MTTSTPPAATGRLERILAYMVAAVVGLSILAFLALIIATSTGMGANDAFSQGAWPVVFNLPLYGLPIGFLFMIALIVIVGRRRSREVKASRQ